MDKTSLGDRMKGYEAVPQNILMKRTPVIIRVDGRAFHTFTKRLKKGDSPFSDVMTNCMRSAAIYLTHYIQGACLAYVQSDEISLLLRDWQTFETQQWFGGKIQKIVSISAAMASTAFNAAYEQYESIDNLPERPLFDSRVFNLPMEEVTNYFVWRQKDAMRNSVSMLSQFHFSHRELQGKKVSDMKEMLRAKGIVWDLIETWNQRGFCIADTCPWSSRGTSIDMQIPIFTENRDYIEKWLNPEYSGEMS